MTDNKQYTFHKAQKILVVADDLKGAVHAGVQSSRRILKTIVLTGYENLNKSLKDCDVLVVDTERWWPCIGTRDISLLSCLALTPV